MIPVVLFAYLRPDLLRLTLDALKSNHIPYLVVFCDAPSSPALAEEAGQVHQLLDQIDWCDVEIHARETHYGLGRSVVSGITDMLARYEAAIICEDDLVCIPGTYDYMVAALNHYRDVPQVMSVTAWTHPRVTPPDVVDQPYFDGRADCWLWGTWAYAWQGMDQTTAQALLRQCQAQGQDIYRYGVDLPHAAVHEAQRNIWAVRWLYYHILKGGLCLRPPRSLVEHIGWDERGTNRPGVQRWKNPDALGPPPALANGWPEPVENPWCTILWRQVQGDGSAPVARPARKLWFRTIMRRLRRFGRV
jgi:hypothetical protein